MADNIELDEGSSGKYACTDDCGAAGHVQGMKLCYSADGIATFVLADADGLETQISKMPLDAVASGTIDADEETVVLTLPPGCGTVACQIVGMPGSSQINFEGSVDGTNYKPVEASNGVSTVNATAADDIFILPGAGYTKVRARAELWGTGAATVTLVGSVGTAASILTGALPVGNNSIGHVDVDSLPADTVAQRIAWANYSNEFTTAQTSQDLVAVDGTKKLYIGRVTIATGYVASATRASVRLYFGTGAYVAGTDQLVFGGEFVTIPGTSLEAYPGVVLGSGAAPFTISAAGDALKLTTVSATHPRLYVTIDYIQV